MVQVPAATLLTVVPTDGCRWTGSLAGVGDTASPDLAVAFSETRALFSIWLAMAPKVIVCAALATVSVNDCTAFGGIALLAVKLCT